jgi:hypothetical protein
MRFGAKVIMPGRFPQLGTFTLRVFALIMWLDPSARWLAAVYTATSVGETPRCHKRSG